MKGYMYILLCSNDSYYTGSTNNLELRLAQHFAGEASNHTKKYPPVKLLYVEEFEHVALAFKREKQIQKWSRKKKEALISGDINELHILAQCQNETHYKHRGFDSAGFGSAGFGSAHPPEPKAKGP